MLANHLARSIDDILVFPELELTGFVLRLGESAVRELSAQQWRELIELDPRHSSLKIPNDQWQALCVRCEGEGTVFFLRQLAAAYAQARGSGRPRIVVHQRGTLLACASSIIALDPAARFLHIVRDPRAAISSIISVRKTKFANYDSARMGRSDAIGLSRHWHDYVRDVSCLVRRYHDRVLQVTYEDFCRDKATHIDTVARFLGVAHCREEITDERLEVGHEEVEIHRHIDKAPMTERLLAWQTELAPWRGWVIEYVLGNVLSEHGYDMYFSKIVRGPRRAVYLALGLTDYFIESARWLVRRLGVAWQRRAFNYRHRRTKAS